MTLIPVRRKSPPREPMLRILARKFNNKMTKLTYRKLRTDNKVRDFIIQHLTFFNIDFGDKKINVEAMAVPGAQLDDATY